ncbi:hypothetical protein CsSME_00032151 [Camellia sinensis var. sinensis]
MAVASVNSVKTKTLHSMDSSPSRRVSDNATAADPPNFSPNPPRDLEFQSFLSLKLSRIPDRELLSLEVIFLYIYIYIFILWNCVEKRIGNFDHNGILCGTIEYGSNVALHY